MTLSVPLAVSDESTVSTVRVVAELKLPGRYVLDAAARGALKTAPGVTFLEDA